MIYLVFPSSWHPSQPYLSLPALKGFLHQNGICIGNPEEVSATIKRFQDIGLDQLVFIPVVGWKTPHEKSLESIAILGEKVLPRFR